MASSTLAAPPSVADLPTPKQLIAPFRGRGASGFVAVTVGGNRRIVALPSGDETDADRPVLVASFTKLWTAVAALRFVSRGELTLETTIADVLPTLSSRPWARSTLRELLTHTSLVPEFDDHAVPGYYGRRDVDFADPEKVLATYVPRDWVERRGVFKYRNAELALVGAMLSKKAGVPAADVLRREVFEPAKMDHAGLLVGTSSPPELDLAPLGKVRAQNFFTAGAGYASAADLLTFFEALEDETLLDATSRAKLEDGDPARGHGALGCWASSFSTASSRTLLVERPGSFGNVRLFSAFLPERRRAVVAWSRQPLEMGNARSGRGIGYELTRALLD